MNRTVIKVVIAVVCAGAAGAGGYFAWRYRKNKKAEAKVNEPLDVEYIPYKQGNVNTIVRDEDDNKISKMDIPKEKFANHIRNYMQTDAEKENFEEYLSEMESPEEDDEEEDEDDDDPPNPKKEKGPYLITAGEFCNNRTYYDKISLNYFSKDDVVADDRDEVMENADKILGDLQSLFATSRASSVIYIRNEELEVDYEVSFVDGSYREEVLRLKDEGD